MCLYKVAVESYNSAGLKYGTPVLLRFHHNVSGTRLAYNNLHHYSGSVWISCSLVILNRAPPAELRCSTVLSPHPPCKISRPLE